MKRILSCVLALALALTCLFSVSCGEKEAVVSRSFVAGYEKTVSMGENETQMSGRVLMNLMSDGTLDLYVGYMSKVSGMGATVYAYALNMKEDGTFDVSIMQMATVMHVWDMSHGTYTVNGDKVTFSYDVMDGEGAVATAGYTSEGTGFTENGLTVGFNIAQTTVRASAAEFIRVK